MALVAAMLPSEVTTAGTPSCAPDRLDEQVVVSYVQDGDTLALRDGRKLRLIGVNAPERGRDHRPAEPLAVEARNRLQALLRQRGNRINLRYDAERRDRHGRVLAHAFLEDGRSLAAFLLEHGLGFTIVVPPNLWNLACHEGAEQIARRQHRGVWGQRHFEPVDVQQLTPSNTGFARIQGRVRRVGTSRNSVWLNLSDRVALRIDRADLRYFHGQPPARLQNKRITARGWLVAQGKRLVMRVRHPAALEAIR